MALEQVFECPRTLAKLRNGALGEVIEGFCRWLLGHGFSRWTVRTHLSNLSHFGAYLAQRGASPSAVINAEDVDGFFIRYPSKCRTRGRGQKHVRRVRQSVSRFVAYLGEAKLFDSLPRQETYQALLDAYLKWMHTYQHAAAGTIEVRRHSLAQFLTWLGPEATAQGLSRLSSEKVERFFLQYAQSMGLSARRSMQSALRTFFRFCIHQGHIQQPLDRAVPTLRTYKLATLPRGLTEVQAQKVLQRPDRRTNAGRRDYSILQLLYTYGVRSGQVRALRLEDINWAENQILFKASKHGKDILLPLTVEVGESMLDYLHYARPHCAYPEVFLTCRAPYRPLGCHHTISEIVRRHIRTAGIDIPHKGAHTFRHGFATRMLLNGHSLKSIADVLGHRHIGTTFLYTKVDFNALKQVALQWPQEVK